MYNISRAWHHLSSISPTIASQTPPLPLVLASLRASRAFAYLSYSAASCDFQDRSQDVTNARTHAADLYPIPRHSVSYSTTSDVAAGRLPYPRVPRPFFPIQDPCSESCRFGPSCRIVPALSMLPPPPPNLISLSIFSVRHLNPA